MSIEVEIKKTLNRFHLDVAFSAGNEVLSLLGGSGCGKSMTLRCIAGIETPDEGRIVVDGVTFFDSKKRINLSPQKRRVGMLFQNYALFPNMTVEQNILTGLKREKSKAARREAVAQAIQTFHLQGLEKNLPSQLSGGQQQRVALARILVGNPTILMLDEPFSALDSYLRWEMEQELAERLKDFSGTTLFVSHSRDEVYRVSDKVAVYGHGVIDVLDTKEGVFQNPKTWQAALLTGCKNLSPLSWREDGTAFAEDWQLSLSLPQMERCPCVGIRAHYIHPAVQPGENVFEMEVAQTVEDPFNMVLFLRPKGTNPPHLLRWAMAKELYAQLPPRSKENTLLVQIPLESLMFLQK